jgi:hypothetical protein
MTVVRLIGVSMLIGVLPEGGKTSIAAHSPTVPVRGATHSNASPRTVKSPVKPDSSLAEEYLGPVVMLQFDRAANLHRLPDGTWSAKLHCSGGKQVIAVRFTEDGLAYLETAAKVRLTSASHKQRGAVVGGGGNAFAVYGRLYGVPSQNAQGLSGRESTYWLVGNRRIVRMGSFPIYLW